MEAQPIKQKKVFNLYGYINAWIKYAGQILIKISDIGDTVRRSLTDIKPPQKNDYY